MFLYDCVYAGLSTSKSLCCYQRFLSVARLVLVGLRLFPQCIRNKSGGPEPKPHLTRQNPSTAAKGGTSRWRRYARSGQVSV